MTSSSTTPPSAEAATSRSKRARRSASTSSSRPRGRRPPTCIAGLNHALDTAKGPAQPSLNRCRVPPSGCPRAGHELTAGAPLTGPRRLAPTPCARVERAAGGLATRSVALMDDRLPWFRTLPAPGAVVGHPGRPGRHRRLRDLGPGLCRSPAHRPGLRHRAPRPGARGVAAAHRRTRPGGHLRRRGAPARARRHGRGECRAARVVAPLQPGDRLLRGRGVRGRGGDPRSVGRQGRGRGGRRDRPGRGRRDPVIQGRRTRLGCRGRSPGDRRAGARRRPGTGGGRRRRVGATPPTGRRWPGCRAAGWC